jgi:hypothetical protein
MAITTGFNDSVLGPMDGAFATLQSYATVEFDVALKRSVSTIDLREVKIIRDQLRFGDSRQRDRIVRIKSDHGVSVAIIMCRI